jgi:hypothetical protein
MITETHRAREKQGFRLGSVISWIRPEEIKAKLYQAFTAHVPVGYEDETGFHIVRQPSPVRADRDSRADF